MAFMGYRLRAADGKFKGLWLTRIVVATKGGITSRGIGPNWLKIALHPGKYRIKPGFRAEESAAWSGTERDAQTFQSILSSIGFPAEIIAGVTRSSFLLVNADEQT
jgi:hypothetical protein